MSEYFLARVCGMVGGAAIFVVIGLTLWPDAPLGFTIPGALGAMWIGALLGRWTAA